MAGTTAGRSLLRNLRPMCTCQRLQQLPSWRHCRTAGARRAQCTQVRGSSLGRPPCRSAALFAERPSHILFVKPRCYRASADFGAELCVTVLARLLTCALHTLVAAISRLRPLPPICCKSNMNPTVLMCGGSGLSLLQHPLHACTPSLEVRRLQIWLSCRACQASTHQTHVFQSLVCIGA